jgi:hypothetical protein
MLLITDYNISYEIYLATGRKIILLPKKNDGGTEAWTFPFGSNIQSSFL